MVIKKNQVSVWGLVWNDGDFWISKKLSEKDKKKITLKNNKMWGSLKPIKLFHSVALTEHPSNLIE